MAADERSDQQLPTRCFLDGWRLGRAGRNLEEPGIPSWLYNESPVKEKIVVNDRGGTALLFHHGVIYTRKSQPDLDFKDHYWEKSRGMVFIYVYNRLEDAWDYNSAQSLVLQLIDKV